MGATSYKKRSSDMRTGAKPSSRRSLHLRFRVGEFLMRCDDEADLSRRGLAAPAL
ncbi:MAG: hypothetical protein JWQ72_2880 [Polaromonas sp.]|nr:hypothetical protein [Polaromonas sp.]